MGCNPILEGAPLFSMRTESVASWHSCRSVDADSWCKQALTDITGELYR